MLSPECLEELRFAWLPHISDAGLDRLVDLLDKSSPLLIHGCFTRAVPMGCLATHIAWHHPRTRHLTLDAGISWLHHVAGLNPATSQVLREWDRRGVHDLELRADLLTLFRNEQRLRRSHKSETATAPELVAVSWYRCGMVIALLENLGRAAHFAWRVLLMLPLTLGRLPYLAVQLHEILLGALPLGVAAGTAIGVVVWLHLRGTLQSVGGPSAVQYLPQALALAVVLEFAPLAAGLIVAGRSGASLGAELGSMRLTEQIDALEVLGQSPLRALVAPRVLACMLTLPLLTLFIAYLALAAGYGAEALGGGLSWTQYRSACLRVLTLHDAVPAVLKTVVFGYLIGISGCWFGINAQGGTEGVGQAATRGVVVSIFLVLVADVVLVKLIQVLG